MKQILVTGATGNIGIEVVRYLNELKSSSEIVVAVRNVESAKKKFNNSENLQYRTFDFEKPDTFSAAFDQINLLFLLRPPHISEVDTFFRPLLISAKKGGINKIVFLSVQAAEKSKIIPHNKIERLIQELGFNYIFVRPSYFMQNLTTSMLEEIQSNRSITLPSADAKFNWIDVKNIGEACAKLIIDFEKYQNKPYEITGSENKNFSEVANLITEVIGEKIAYKSINPVSFYFRKRKEGVEKGFAIVMTILHFLPRFQSEPKISDNYQMLTGKDPTRMKEFLKREKDEFKKPY